MTITTSIQNSHRRGVQFFSIALQLEEIAQFTPRMRIAVLLHLKYAFASGEVDGISTDMLHFSL